MLSRNAKNMAAEQVLHRVNSRNDQMSLFYRAEIPLGPSDFTVKSYYLPEGSTT
jgi:hypothetical protein